MNKNIIAAALIFAAAIFIFSSFRKMKILSPTKPLRYRGCDAGGCGHFGASRSGGTRKHRGIDILTVEKEAIFAPISGKIRIAKPYPDDNNYSGVEIYGSNFNVKIFYFQPIVKAGQIVEQGQLIGYAQQISKKWTGVKDHIHLELRYAGVSEPIDPKPFIVSSGVLA